MKLTNLLFIILLLASCDRKPLIMFGDSFTSGRGASSPERSYAYILAQHGFKLENYAVSGSGLQEAIFSIFAHQSRIKEGSTITLMTGINDLYKSDSVQKTIELLKPGMTAFIAANFMEEYIPGTRLQKIGWKDSSFSDVEYKSKYVQDSLPIAVSSKKGAKLQWLFRGESVVVGYLMSDSIHVSLGAFSVSIDGKIMDTIYCNKADGNTKVITRGRLLNQYLFPAASCYFDLGAKEHSVEITSLNSLPVAIDYIGTVSTTKSNRLVLGYICKSTDSAYKKLNPVRPISDSIIDEANRRIVEAAKPFMERGYAVSLVDANKYFDNKNTADKLHPNDLGHQQIAKAFEEVLLH